MLVISMDYFITKKKLLPKSFLTIQKYTETMTQMWRSLLCTTFHKIRISYLIKKSKVMPRNIEHCLLAISLEYFLRHVKEYPVIKTRYNSQCKSSIVDEWMDQVGSIPCIGLWMYCIRIRTRRGIYGQIQPYIFDCISGVES